MSGRPKAPLVLTDTEREELKALTLRRKTAQALALRARIVLACADGTTTRWWLRASASHHRWSASGEHGLSNIAWMACWTHHAQARQEPSTMPA